MRNMWAVICVSLLVSTGGVCSEEKIHNLTFAKMSLLHSTVKVDAIDGTVGDLLEKLEDSLVRPNDEGVVLVQRESDKVGPI